MRENLSTESCDLQYLDTGKKNPRRHHHRRGEVKLVNKEERWERMEPLTMSKNGFHKVRRAGYQPLGLPRWFSGKESASQCRRPKRCLFNPWVGKIPWREEGNPLQCQPLARTMGRLSELFLIGIASWGCR